MFPQSLRKQHSPADSLIRDIWSLELGERKRLLFETPLSAAFHSGSQDTPTALHTRSLKTRSPLVLACLRVGGCLPAPSRPPDFCPCPHCSMQGHVPCLSSEGPPCSQGLRLPAAAV